MHLYLENFSIRVFEIGNNAPLFSMENGNTVLDIKSDTSLFNPNASVIMADPFLFVKNGVLYLFYEHLTRWEGTGRICMRSTCDLKNWTAEKDVLIEPYHLSFPFVFEDEGKVYMLPETGGDKSITLYEAESDDLTKWRKVKKLMEDEEPWYDSIIYQKEGKYYLFTGHDDNVQQIQHLFVSDSLTGPYSEHPCSPICEGRDRARNAGSLIDGNSQLYRPVQICMNGYGEQTSIMKIEKLTPSDYAETLYKKDIVDTNQVPYKEGGHQWNMVEFMGKRIVATDYRERNYNLVELVRKIRRKFRR
jgi:hypothetical protein